MTSNRGSVSTQTIADKLKTVEEELGITPVINKRAPSTPLLFVNGRLDHKKYNYIAKNFSLLEPLHTEIKSLCKGVDLTILNYLIYSGLQKIKENGEFQSIEYSEFESQIKLNL
jgi:hypothetical protein